MADHFLYLAQALIVASQRTPAWRTADEGKPCSIIDIFNLAKPYDEKRKPEDSYYFMVSAEGAICISTGAEYLLRWLFIPMEPGEERDALVKKVAQEYDRAEAELQAEEEAARKAEEAARQAKAAAKEPSTGAESPVCLHCGAPIKNPNAKFCSHCGKPLK